MTFAGVTRRPIVSDWHLTEPDPAHHAADEAMLLRHAVENIQHAARHQTEIAGIDRQVGVADPPHQPIEQRRGAALEYAFALPLAAKAVDHVGIGALHQPPHLAEQFGRVLQIGVNGQNTLATAGVEAGGNRQLMAVTARKIDRHHTWIAAHQIRHDRPGAIGGAVVEQDQFIIGADSRLRGGRHAAVKFLDALLFIEARRDDGKNADDCARPKPPTRTPPPSLSAPCRCIRR